MEENQTAVPVFRIYLSKEKEGPARDWTRMLESVENTFRHADYKTANYCTEKHRHATEIFHRMKIKAAASLNILLNVKTNNVLSSHERNIRGSSYIKTVFFWLFKKKKNVHIKL